MSRHPPSGGGQRGSRLLIPPNAPTPQSSPSPPRGCSRQLQVRQERPVGRGRKGRMLRASGGGRGDASDPPCAPPAPGPGLYARRGLEAPLRRAPPAPAAARRPGAGSRTWPGPATALLGRPTRLPGPDSAPARRPPAPLPRPGAASACPAGPGPSRGPRAGTRSPA